MHIQNNDITPATSQNYTYGIPSLTNSTLLTADTTWCGRKVMRLATLCMNRQCCYLPLHMAVRLTPTVDSVQVSTCYSCYAIV